MSPLINKDTRVIAAADLSAGAAHVVEAAKGAA